MALSADELEELEGDLERAVERHDDYVEDTIRQVSDAYESTVRDILDDVRSVDPGDMDASDVAQRRLEILESGQAVEAIWQDWSERLDGILDQIDDYHDKLDGASEIDREVVETLKGVWPEGDEMPQGIAGDMYELGTHHRKQLANSLTRNVLGGLPRDQMVEELEEVTGRARHQAEQLVRDTSMGYSRTVNAKKSENYDYFRYVGPDDSATRDFCRRRVGKVYSRDEIDEMDNGQTGSGTAFTRGGGYNCRHHWRPVRRSWYSDDDWQELTGD